MPFKPAVKYAQRLRLALCGPTGSGKTYTALVIAQELAGPDGLVGVIDTEHGSASLYSDEFTFQTLELTSFEPKKYVSAIREAEAAGITVLIIDSLSHAWMGVGGALDQVDKAGARMGGNKFAAWRDVTPQHNELVDAILSAKMHIICTMRSKMEYILEEKVKDGRTTVVPRKVGMAPIQRDGVEYEFTLVGEMDINHSLVITKTRINALDGVVVSKPDKDIAVTILGWLHGETRPEPAATAPEAATPDTRPPAEQYAEHAAQTNGAKPPTEPPAEGITPAQTKAIRAVLTQAFGKDRLGACAWVKDTYPEAFSDGGIHLSPLSKKRAADMYEALRKMEPTPAEPAEATA